MIEAYVEVGVAMAADSGVAAWSFAPELWGRCGQDRTGDGAGRADRPADRGGRASRRGRAGVQRRPRPATPAQRDATLAILARARAETVALITGTPDEVLDRDDPDRVLPAFASWRTLRQMAWHLADTESRYYLPSLGLPARPRLPDLVDELAASAEHVRRSVLAAPPALVRTEAGATWTTTKLLRRLAWHEASELATMRALARSCP